MPTKAFSCTLQVDISVLITDHFAFRRRNKKIPLVRLRLEAGDNNQTKAKFGSLGNPSDYP